MRAVEMTGGWKAKMKGAVLGYRLKPVSRLIFGLENTLRTTPSYPVLAPHPRIRRITARPKVEDFDRKQRAVNT